MSSEIILFSNTQPQGTSFVGTQKFARVNKVKEIKYKKTEMRKQHTKPILKPKL